MRNLQLNRCGVLTALTSFVKWQEEMGLDWLAGPATFLSARLPGPALQSQPAPGGGSQVVVSALVSPGGLSNHRCPIPSSRHSGVLTEWSGTWVENLPR